MQFIHYSAAPIEPIQSVGQDDGRPMTRGDKPNGFWVSVKGERDWPEFCYGERWNMESFKHAYEITLVGNILILETDDALRTFSKAYSVGSLLGGINWKLVASRYQGIVIAPYQYTCRYDLNWYYPWDVASGCIWDATAISKITNSPHEIPAWALQPQPKVETHDQALSDG